MIAIVGRGNVAAHLFKALEEKADVKIVNPHTLEDWPEEDPEVVIICVKDSAIAEVARKLPKSNAVVCHTAGSVDMDILKQTSKKYGVLYPLQTFSKNQPLDYKKIPVFVEGSSQEALEELRLVADLFSDNVRVADSMQRKQLHLASVFVCNFTNSLAQIGRELMTDCGIDSKVLLPLMEQTVEKLHHLSPREAQTGPASRKDTNVMNSHMEMLEDKPILQEIYSLLSSYIMNQK